MQRSAELLGLSRKPRDAIHSVAVTADKFSAIKLFPVMKPERAQKMKWPAMRHNHLSTANGIASALNQVTTALQGLTHL